MGVRGMGWAGMNGGRTQEGNGWGWSERKREA